MKWTRALVAKVMLESEYKSSKQLGEEIGVSANAIRKILQRFGVKRQPLLTEKQHTLLLSLVNSMRNKEIANYFNIGKGQLEWYLRKHKITRKNKSMRNYKEIQWDVDSKTGCWICTSHHKTGSGPIKYPSICRNGKRTRISRYMLAKKLGRPIEKGKYACHTCDNPECINPDHLYEGTHKSNTMDMVRRERHRVGESVNTAKLTVDDVRELRPLLENANTSKLKELGKKYGVSYRTLRDIRDGITWKSVR